MNYKYKAFISYSRNDKNTVDWFHKNLEIFSLPRNIQIEYPHLELKLGKFFKDTEELSCHYDLSEALKDALDKSEYLIVFCSKSSAVSQYVNQEIEYFISKHSYKNIIPIIINGEPNASLNPKLDILEESFPKVFRENSYNYSNPLAIDIRVEKDSKKRALIKIISKLLNVDFDFLWQRELKRLKIKKMIYYSVIFILIIFINVLIHLFLNSKKLIVENNNLTNSIQNIDSKIQNSIESERNFQQERVKQLQLQHQERVKEAIKEREEVEKSIEEYKKTINNINIEDYEKNVFKDSCIRNIIMRFGILKEERLNNFCLCIYESGAGKIWEDEHKITNCKNSLVNDFKTIKDQLSVRDFFIGQSITFIKLINKNLSEEDVRPIIECIYDTNKKENDFLTTDELIIKHNYNYLNIKSINSNIIQSCQKKYPNINL